MILSDLFYLIWVVLMRLPGLLEGSGKAVLALADGTVFSGIHFGADNPAVGEIVFNTAMTGYQEVLTDPSYRNQIVTFTYPHIGNVGTNDCDQESAKVQVSGAVIGQLSSITSSWRSQSSLADYFKQHDTIGIAGIDTRYLTRLLRDQGAQAACVMAGEDQARAIAMAQSFTGLAGQDLTSKVSCDQIQAWSEPSPVVANGRFAPVVSAGGAHIVVIDYGVKQNILRLLVDRGCKVSLVPAATSAAAILDLAPDGVLLSNGPGDPAACKEQLQVITDLLARPTLPLLGICLGFQLLAIASGGHTYKMKLGHHGANHPVQEIETGQVFITSQNHGFAVAQDSLPACCHITHRSLFDNTVQGFAYRDRPILAVQGHPEAAPGPHDFMTVFDQFIGFVNHA